LCGSFAPREVLAARSRKERLRIGAQTNTWGVPIKSYDHLLEICDSLAKIGYTGFETNYKSLEPLAARAGECRKVFESRHVPLIAAHSSASMADREKQAQEISSLLTIGRYSAKMGATHMVVSGRKLPQEDGKLDVDAAHAKAAGLNKLAAACRQEGLKLCYHNHAQEFQDDPSEMSFLLAETDPELVWLAYDSGNPYPLSPDAAAFSAANFRRIAIYHIKDAVPADGPRQRNVDINLGEGKVNLKGVVSPVLNSGWEGWLVVEREGAYPNPAGNPEELLRKCRDYVKQITGV